MSSFRSSDRQPARGRQRATPASFLPALLAVALTAAPMPSQVTYPARSADSAAAVSARTEQARRAAVLRLLAALDSAERRAARALFAMDRLITSLRVDTTRIYSPGDGRPASPVVSLTPGGAAYPYAFDDFSTYRSEAEMLASPLYRRADNTQGLSLDRSVGYGSSRQSMRFTFPNRVAEGTTTGVDGYCTSYVVTREAPIRSEVKHVWVEVWARFSNNFTVKAPESWGCRSGQDYKFLFIVPRPNAEGRYGRFQMDMPGYKWSVAYPDMPGGDESVQPPAIPLALVPNMLWNGGGWHRYRMEAKLSSAAGVPDGLVREWVDDVKIWEKTGVVIDRPGFDSIKFGANINQGPAVPQHIWWGKWSLWVNDPGW
jgi:hypothetical protein